MSKILILEAGTKACLNPMHSGFAHGFGVFETIRFSAGYLEFWKAHFERLSRSAAAFDIAFTLSEDAVLSAIRKRVQSEHLQEGIVKLSLLCEHTDSCCYVYTRSTRPLSERVHVCLTTSAPLNEHSSLAGHKTHNYMESVHLLRSAQADGYSDAIRLNTGGFLAETTVANLFFIKGGCVYTPALSTGILPGIIRAEVIKACKAHGIPVEEGRYPIECLQACEAVFLTNSSVGMQAVERMDVLDFSHTLDVVHPVFNRLNAAFEEQKKIGSIVLQDE